MKHLPSIILGLLAGAFFSAAGVAIASRNAAGTFSLFTPGNPVVTATTISSAWANNTLNDLATEMTDSLSRSGKGAMLASLQLFDGTVTSPGLNFGSAAGSGLYKIGTNDFGFSVNQVKSTEWKTTGFAVTAVTGGSASAWVSSPSATQQARYMLQDQGTDKFGLVKQTDNSALFFDFANSRAIWSVATGATAPMTIDAGAKIGASGTAISASFRGTMSITPGTVIAAQCVSQTLTLTGATAGSDCLLTAPDAGGTSSDFLIPRCFVTTDTCNMRLCNSSTGSVVDNTARTYACRVFNT